MNSQLVKKIFTIVGIFTSSILLAIILAPLGGMIHMNALNVNCGGGLFLLEGFDRTCNFDGFTYVFIFLLSFFSFLLLQKKMAWIVFIIGSSIFWIATLLFIFMDWPRVEFDETTGSLIIMLVSFVLGWLLAQGILLGKKRMGVSKK